MARGAGTPATVLLQRSGVTYQLHRYEHDVDISASSFPTVFVSAGRRGLQVELAAADLVSLATATQAPITTDRSAR